MFAIKKAASWLLAAQFFNATTVVSCMRTSCSSRRHITSALTIRVCLTIICAPSSELAPQFPRVMAAYSRAPLCSFGGSVWLSTTAIESSAPGVCAMRGRAGQPAASRRQAAAAQREAHGASGAGGARRRGETDRRNQERVSLVRPRQLRQAVAGVVLAVRAAALEDVHKPVNRSVHACDQVLVAALVRIRDHEHVLEAERGVAGHCRVIAVQTAHQHAHLKWSLELFHSTSPYLSESPRSMGVRTAAGLRKAEAARARRPPVLAGCLPSLAALFRSLSGTRRPGRTQVTRSVPGPLLFKARFILLIFFWEEKSGVCLSENRAENRAQNREESACGALLRALHAPGGADEARIACGCPASLCTAP